MKKRNFFLPVIFLVIGLLLGAVIFGRFGQHSSHDHSSHNATGTKWTCSMHPQVQQPKPGKCPICAMDLIPLIKKATSSGNPHELVMTESAKKLARVETTKVKRQFIETQIRLVGKIAFDETRTRTVAARFPARIDRLYIDYTGIQVRKGDHLARIYSPELLTAQRELLSAIKFGSNIDTARNKLRLWDLSDSRIREIEKLGKPSERMEIDALISGIVIDKRINEGDYVTKGQPLFTIADLSSVWVKLAAYESDAPWLRYGQPVEFEATAVPGKRFSGIIAFISPTLNPETRTFDIRVNAENPDYLLKPDMFVKSIISPKLAANGKVIAPEMKGKWVSPMHPEIVRDKPGPCPVCGMALVKAEELGYSVAKGNSEMPLIVPASAVLHTGKRSLVYIEKPDTKEPTYEGRQITLGPRAGDFYLVEQGLKEGENVVTYGNFKIDSALQIVAKRSMMNPGPKPKEPVLTTPDDFRKNLSLLLDGYFKIQNSLASDDLATSKKTAIELGESLQKITAKSLDNKSAPVWKTRRAELATALSELKQIKNIDSAREIFETLSQTFTLIVDAFQPSGGSPVYQAHCPMAFNDKGAFWLQNSEEIRNPYFGAKMLNCGSVKNQLLEAKPKE